MLSRWFDVYVFALGTSATRRVAVLFSNTTERKRQEKRQAFLFVLADATRSLTGPADIMTTVSELVGGYYEVGRCGFADVPPPHDHLIIEHEWTNGRMPSLQGTYPLSRLGNDYIQQSGAGQTVVVDATDVRSEEHTPEADWNDRSRSSIWVPLLKEDQWVASFYIQDAGILSWTPAEVSLMEEIAERSWAAVERARAEEALREEDRRKEEFMAMLGHELRNPRACCRIH